MLNWFFIIKKAANRISEGGLLALFYLLYFRGISNHLFHATRNRRNYLKYFTANVNIKVENFAFFIPILYN